MAVQLARQQQLKLPLRVVGSDLEVTVDDDASAAALRASCGEDDDETAKVIVSSSLSMHLSHESAAVRADTALEIARLLLPALAQAAPALQSQLLATRVLLAIEGSSVVVALCYVHHLTLVSCLLHTTLAFAVSEPDAKTRRRVLEALDSRLDPLLCEPRSVALLAQAMHDENVGVRRTILNTLSRLAQLNPACVGPHLRKLLLQLLTELEFSAEVSQQEEATQLLVGLASNAPSFVEPYLSDVFKSVVQRLEEAVGTDSLKLAGHLLEALGQLTEVSGQEIRPMLDQVLQLLVQVIQDQGRGASSLKREQLHHAYRALCMVVGNTGYSVNVHDKYPSLLPLLISVLRSDVHMGKRQHRQQILRCLGTLGALEPSRFQRLAAANKADGSEGGARVTVTLLDSGSRTQHWTSLLNIQNEWQLPIGAEGKGDGTIDPFAAPAMAALLKVLRDVSLDSHHALVIQVLMKIFKACDKDCQEFLPQIVEAALRILRGLPSEGRQGLLRHLADMVRIVGAGMGPFLTDIFGVVRSLLEGSETPAVTRGILALLEEISRFHHDALKAYLGPLLPSIIGLLHHSGSAEQQAVARQVLRTLVVFGRALGDSLHIVIPALVKCCEDEDDEYESGGQEPFVRECAVRALGELSGAVAFPHLLGRVMHPLLRILDAPAAAPELRLAVIDSLRQLAASCPEEYAIFEPQVQRALSRCLGRDRGASELPARDSSAAERSLLFHGSFIFGELADEEADIDADEQPSLTVACEVADRTTKEHWVEWMREFSLALLRESASPALRACWPVAQVYWHLAEELFQVSFLSCWLRLADQYQDALVCSLETALQSPNLPPDILQVLLDLAELMDRSGLPLPIEVRTLGGLAEKCHAYAKALQYKESEFAISPAACVEALISINTHLQLTEAAQGILNYAQKYLAVELREPWYERLRRWEDALEAYEVRQLEDPSFMEWTRSRLRCLHELGEWPRLSALARRVWEEEEPLQDASRVEIAPLAAAAEFHLRDWDRMAVFIDALEGSQSSSYEGFLYSAILAVHRENYNCAFKFISRARETLEPELIALVGESYTRAYGGLIKVQQLAELEEIIKYKTTDREATRRALRETWNCRLLACRPSVEVWQAALEIRSIVIPPQEDMSTWLRFCALCRKSSRLDLAMKALDQLRSDQRAASIVEADDPRVVVAHLKNLHAAGCKQQACDMLRACLANENTTSKMPKTLLARCHLKMGLWTREVFEDETKTSFVSNERVLDEVLTWMWSAVEQHAEYKVWNALALANYQACGGHEIGSQSMPASPYVVHAVRGFVQSIILAPQPRLQDILRLVTLWFNYAGNPEVEPALQEGFSSAPLTAWLQVVPQIFARFRSPNEHLRRTIQDLLSKLARRYPQAVVFPLTVAGKSPVDSVAASARQLLEGMRRDGSEKLVKESEMVSEELIRISILWHEQWCEALEEASRYYHTEDDPQAMIKVLRPLYDRMQAAGPTTMREIAFQQEANRELQEAWSCILRFETSGSRDETEHAWQFYYKVFQKLRKQIQGLTHLDMQSVSPRLLQARRLELAVPGTYDPEQPDKVVTISSFSASIEVVTSKQRPRILQILGSDGRKYQFLLKGHEDLKQDERVMQLFGLINCLLATPQETSAGDLSIARFAVVPLSTNSGLIEWVPRCDTLHSLIRMYRKASLVELSVEYQTMRSVCSRCDDLSTLQRVEVFRHALESTSGADLRRVLWLQAKNSEVWLSRRTTYCRSLAVMSMVGYILGLGDRHPSNLMLARESGQVVHIDFGDCFEIAAFREKYPERIPFRLTRMLLNALEVSGVEGNYRHTCELVMRLLRSNKDAVMAMLEAFVFDPLITWRLLPAHVQRAGTAAAGAELSASLRNAGDISGAPGLAVDRAPADWDVDPHLASQSGRQARQRELRQHLGPEGLGADPELLSATGQSVISRVYSKLTGTDFRRREALDVEAQVERLFQEATSHENLSQCYVGWCPFW